MKASIVNLAIITSALCFISCSDDKSTPPNPKTLRSDMVAIPFFVENAEGEMPVEPQQELYEARLHQPVLAPDGSHITWSEYSAVSGNIEVECMAEGTMISLEVKGLVPNGVYTIWNVTVKEPGLNPDVADMNISGIGAAGTGDGSDNVFTADSEGSGAITLVSQGGDMSVFGDIAPCSLTAEYEWHVVGTYHIDGKTYGPELGPEGTVAEQFGFIFRQN